MKRDKLRSGMIVEFEDGKIGMVLLNTTFGDIVAGGCWNMEEGIKNSDRTWFNFEAWNSSYRKDLVKVYAPKSNMLAGSFNVEELDVVWERSKSPIELTMDEIAEKLGIDVNLLKIIK